MGKFRKGSCKQDEYWDGIHRFEHWYRDNTVYFITARVRGRQHAFKSEEAKLIFWSKFDQYTKECGFVPWVTSLLDNHYHKLGYLKIGEQLPKLMKRLHGSIAKLVNDTLETRIVPFWSDGGHQTYFDGCIRDELQARRAYRYVLLQSQRHGITTDWRTYAHTRVNVELDRAIHRSHELRVFLSEVPYKRYEQHRAKGGRSRWTD